jgi:mono/diheme cytochrome c family protein
VASNERAPRFRISPAHLVGGVLVVLAVAATVLPASASSGASGRAAGTTKIAVTLGKPFTVSPKAAPAGTVLFDVRNAATVPYRFAVCTKQAPTAPASTVTACTFKTTPLLKPGKSSTLVLAAPTNGSYRYYEYTTPASNEFLKPPKSAGAGMSGAIAVSGGAAAGGGAGGQSGSQGSAAGAAIFKSKCGSCHALQAAGTRGGIGPDLDQLAPSKAVIVRQVRAGGSQMPSFAAALTLAQIDEVAAYVYSSTHK